VFSLWCACSRKGRYSAAQDDFSLQQDLAVEVFDVSTCTSRYGRMADIMNDIFIAASALAFPLNPIKQDLGGRCCNKLHQSLLLITPPSPGKFFRVPMALISSFCCQWRGLGDKQYGTKAFKMTFSVGQTAKRLLYVAS
jgi:hypothetical protein